MSIWVLAGPCRSFTGSQGSLTALFSPPPVMAANTTTRGPYKGKEKEYPTSVDTPETAEELESLNKNLKSTRKDMKRWEFTKPEKWAKAHAYEQVLLAARAHYDYERVNYDREGARVDALANQELVRKEAAKTQMQLAKFAATANAAAQFASNMTHSRTTLSEQDESAKEAMRAASSSAEPRAKRARKAVSKKPAAQAPPSNDSQPVEGADTSQPVT